MKSTWRARTLSTVTDFSRVPGSEGLIGILNTTHDAIEVRNIAMQSPSGLAGWDTPASPAVTIGRYRIMRISSVTGGSDLSYNKFNSSNTDLPEQILLRLKPDSAEETDIIRFIGDTPGVVYKTAVGAMASGLYGATRPACDFGGARVFGTIKDDGVAQLVIKEGEGIAIMEPEVQTMAHLQMIEVIFRNPATSETYSIFSDRLSTREPGAKPSFAIFNGVGSGVTLEVVQIFLPDIGSVEAADFSGYRVAFFGSFIDGEEITPVPSDSSNTLPTGIQVRKNFTLVPCALRDALIDARSYSDSIPKAVYLGVTLQTYFSQGVIRTINRSPYQDIQPMRNELGVGRTILRHSADNVGLVLRRNQGLGIFYGDNSGWLAGPSKFTSHTFNNVDIAIEFTHEPGVDPNEVIAQAIWTYPRRTLTS